MILLRPDGARRTCDNCGAQADGGGCPEDSCRELRLTIERGPGRRGAQRVRIDICEGCLVRIAGGPAPVVAHMLHELGWGAPKIPRERMPERTRFANDAVRGRPTVPSVGRPLEDQGIQLKGKERKEK